MSSSKFVLGAIAVIAILGVAAAILRVDRSQGVDEQLLLTATSTTGMNQDLQTETLQGGNGEVAAPGNKVTVHYRGTLENGQVFDESYQRGEPFTFNLGAGQVIPGWEQGVAGMRVGEKRRLVIPGSLAYGERGVPGSPIGPNATLIFEVELLAVEK